MGQGNATLQIVRRGGTFLLLRRHGESLWILENKFVRNDLPATVQAGITTYTDRNTVAAGWNFVSPVQPYHQNHIVNVGVGLIDGNPDAANPALALEFTRSNGGTTITVGRNTQARGYRPDH